VSGADGAVVELEDVSRWYGDVVALSSVTARIGTGVTALLGPNGAGKTTLIRVVCGLIRPSSGTVRVLGRRPREDISLWAEIGYVPEHDSLIERLTARRSVEVAAQLQGVGDAGTAARDALGTVELEPDDPRPVRTYSHGMRQRVKVAAALVHRPAILVLDEPLAGLDPEQRRALIALFRDLGTAGTAVIVSSHVLDEVARLGERVLVMVDGQLAAEGDYRRIRELMEDRPHRLRIETDAPRRLGAALLAGGLADDVELLGERGLVAGTSSVGTLRSGLAAAARDQQARLREVVPLGEDLDSVFRELVRRRR
jgi:ABC-2 type transport system ATP-binding protein